MLRAIVKKVERHSLVQYAVSRISWIETPLSFAAELAPLQVEELRKCRRQFLLPSLCLLTTSQ